MFKMFKRSIIHCQISIGLALLALLAWPAALLGSDFLMVAGGRLEAACGTLQFALESSPSSGVQIARLNAGGGITGQLPSPLFELTLRDASGQHQTLRSDEGWQQVSMRKSDSRGCLLRFSRPMLGSRTPLSLAISIRLMGSDDEEPGFTFTWDECKVPEGWTLENTILLPLHFGSLPQGTRFFYPYSSGILCDPVTQGLERRIAYPAGFGASMGWYALYGPQGGLYYAAHDPDATFKHLYMKGTPGSSLEMWFDYPASAQQGRQAVPADAYIILAPLQGDWFDGAMRYRNWVRSQANWYPRDKIGPQGRTDSPLWMKELSLWVHGGPAEVKGFQRAVGVPLGFHWYNWHGIPFDNDYPHYFPARPGFRQTIEDLQASNVYVMPYINGRLWDTRDCGTRDSLFSSLARPAVTKNWDGTDITERYGSKETDGSDVTFGVMCPQSDIWRSKLREVVLGICAPASQGGHATKAVYMDQIAAAPPVCCFDATHGHPLGGGGWWTQAYRGMLQDIRAAKPQDVALTTESNADGYTDLFDGFLVWQFAHDGQVPAFGAVYGGSIQLFGRTYASTDPTDFKMALAQSFVWGEQLGWFQANAFLAALPYTPSIFSFLRQVVWLRHQFSPYFYMGEMTRAPHLLGNNPEQVGRWQFGGTMGPVRFPSVLCGAWAIPGQHRTLLLFANYSSQDVTLSLDYPLEEWGLREGQYEVSRYGQQGTPQPLDGLPSQIVFHPDEAFVLELTSTTSSVSHKVSKGTKNQGYYYDLSGRRVSKNQRGIVVGKNKRFLKTH